MPCSVRRASVYSGVLRLRDCFALRSSSFAQDDGWFSLQDWAGRALNVLSASFMMLNEVSMKRKVPVVFLLLISGLSFLLVSPLSAQPKVALTFDDLPAHGDIPVGLTRAE